MVKPMGRPLPYIKVHCITLSCLFGVVWYWNTYQLKHYIPSSDAASNQKKFLFPASSKLSLLYILLCSDLLSEKRSLTFTAWLFFRCFFLIHIELNSKVLFLSLAPSFFSACLLHASPFLTLFNTFQNIIILTNKFSQLFLQRFTRLFLLDTRTILFVSANGH